MIIIKEGDGGSYVEMVQLALRRAGFPPNEESGNFSGQTKQAVIAFQNSRGLIPDGIVGKATFTALRPYLTGYIPYTVRAGDSFFTIAQRLGSTVALIENANPGIDYNQLPIGRRLNVPLNFPLVPTDISYSALLCELVSEGLTVRYPFISLSVPGNSVQGRPLTVLKMGRGNRKVFFNAAHHANEWITTPVLLKFAEDYAIGVTDATELGGQNSEFMFDSATLYMMPMVDPDGVDLVTGAIERDSDTYMDVLQMANDYPQIPFPSGWKANIRGVDLNLNYPAEWERARTLKFAAGYTRPGPRDFVGDYPLSEPESRTVASFSEQEDFNLTVSLHTQGEVIYWKFMNYNPPGAEEIARKMAAVSGYELADTPEFSSYAGYKDWFIMTFNRPGYTVEAGRGASPVPLSQFASIYRAVLPILTTALAAEEQTPVESTNG